MEDADDRVGVGRFIVKRFNERYFDPIVIAPQRHGFALMAVACLVIETLECFYEGRRDSKGDSRKVFSAFFVRRTGLEVFGEGAKDWFYKQVRCGILHQAEVLGGWRILRSGPLLDATERTINAKKFVDTLQKAVTEYALKLQDDEDLWRNLLKKMDAVCENCLATP
ncbi:hypothetical protein [uncultured Hydrogenophaga sp.]|uniref:hypothetical protein n=1 Tax=uncultured Hydrogenophaga sp. TaxID=199683 RepID=UPI002582D495|nr:hypothetical protein [uncultured Hydrogenophaga sp.]